MRHKWRFCDKSGENKCIGFTIRIVPSLVQIGAIVWKLWPNAAYMALLRQKWRISYFDTDPNGLTKFGSYPTIFAEVMSTLTHLRPFAPAGIRTHAH